MSEPREQGARDAPDYRPHHREPFVAVTTPPPSPEQLTWVELVFDPGRTERWIRFGQGADQRIVSRRNRFVAFPTSPSRFNATRAISMGSTGTVRP